MLKTYRTTMGMDTLHTTIYITLQLHSRCIHIQYSLPIWGWAHRPCIHSWASAIPPQRLSAPSFSCSVFSTSPVPFRFIRIPESAPVLFPHTPFFSPPGTHNSLSLSSFPSPPPSCYLPRISICHLVCILDLCMCVRACVCSSDFLSTFDSIAMTVYGMLTDSSQTLPPRFPAQSSPFSPSSVSNVDGKITTSQPALSDPPEFSHSRRLCVCRFHHAVQHRLRSMPAQ